jgi:hypothetical protein
MCIFSDSKISILLGTGEGTVYEDNRIIEHDREEVAASMKKAVKAKIDWISCEDGGRKNILPVGMRYCPIIIFEPNQSDDTLWSAEIYNTSIDGRHSLADVSYLVDDGAPFDLLQSGNRFSLYEGPRVVAEGIVI